MPLYTRLPEDLEVDVIIAGGKAFFNLNQFVHDC